VERAGVTFTCCHMIQEAQVHGNGFDLCIRNS
jgi:hypothetical protein